MRRLVNGGEGCSVRSDDGVGEVQDEAVIPSFVGHSSDGGEFEVGWQVVFDVVPFNNAAEASLCPFPGIGMDEGSSGGCQGRTVAAVVEISLDLLHGPIGTQVDWAAVNGVLEQ